MKKATLKVDQTAGLVAEPALRPKPWITAISRAYWDGIESGVLTIQRCDGCQHLHHPPVARCGRCDSWNFSYPEMSGNGVVYGFGIVRHPVMEFNPDSFAAAVVELDEGPRVLSTIVGCEFGQITIGMPVRALFEPLYSSNRLLLFGPR